MESISNPGSKRSIRCSAHPDEQIIAMCGCGTLFCRKCSSSAVFCARCNEAHENMVHTRAQLATISHPAFTLAHVHGGSMPQSRHAARPVPRRVILEALILTIVSVVVFGLIFQMDHESIALGTAGEITSYGIDVRNDPLQQQTQKFSMELPVYNGLATLTSSQSYSISAKVESKKEYDDVMSGTVPYDLLLAWGDMATTQVDSKFTWEQSGREGLISGTLGGSDGADVDKHYVSGHVSNNHVVPANDRVLNGLRAIKPGDRVRIEGRLVDVRLRTDDNRGLTMKTSTSRQDQGDGACEIIFVERIKVNETSYK